MKKILSVSAIFILITITVLSLLPPKSGMHLPTNDKIGHFLAYTTLSLNACLLFPNVNQKMFFSLLGITLYGVLIEFLQGFIGRDTSFFDFLANSLGVLMGSLIFVSFRKHLQKFLKIT